MTKAILFDADGVVINRDSWFSKRFSEEYKVPHEEIQKFFNTEFQPCLIGKADIKQAIKPYLEKWGWKKSVDAMLKYWFESENNPNQAVIESINQLKRQGISCYLATNQEKYRMEYMADKMGFLQLFDHMFVSCEISHKKPDDKFFDYIWDSLQYLDGISDKKEVMLWDNKEEVVKSGNEYGFDSHQFISFENYKQIIESITDITLS